MWSRVASAAAALTVLSAAGSAEVGIGQHALRTDDFRLLPAPAPIGSAQPNLATDAAGRIWLSWLAPGAGREHQLQLASLTGHQWSTPITVASGTQLLANWADFPSVFVSASGTMAAHWLQLGSQRGVYGVRVRTSSDDGRTWGDVITPYEDDSPTEHGFVSFFDTPTGALGLVWLDGRAMVDGTGRATGGSMALRSALVEGSAVAGEQVVDPRVCDCCQTSAARTTEGVVVAYRDRSDSEIRDISVARYVEGHWSAPSRVHADDWQVNACPVNGPVVVARDAAVAVAWFTAEGGDARAAVAFSADGGRTFDAPVSLGETRSYGRLGMVMAGPDRVFVSSMDDTGEGAALVVRDVRRDGSVGAPATVTTLLSDRSSGFARLALVGSRLVVAWTRFERGQPTRVELAEATVHEAP